MLEKKKVADGTRLIVTSDVSACWIEHRVKFCDRNAYLIVKGPCHVCYYPRNQNAGVFVSFADDRPGLLMEFWVMFRSCLRRI